MENHLWTHASETQGRYRGMQETLNILAALVTFGKEVLFTRKQGEC